VNTTPEPPGSNCAAGGERIDVGIDTNGDGVLEAAEVQQTTYVCNGAAGSAYDAGAEDAAVGTDAGPVVIGQLVVPQLEANGQSATFDVVAYSWTSSLGTGFNANGLVAGKPSVGGLSVTVLPIPEGDVLSKDLVEGKPVVSATSDSFPDDSVTLTVTDPAGGAAGLVFKLSRQVFVSSAQDVAGSLQAFTFEASELQVKTDAATATYTVTSATSTCTGACCPAAGTLGPYVEAEPGWAIESGAVRVVSLTDQITNPVQFSSVDGPGVGKPSVGPTTVTTDLEPTVACAFGYLSSGTSLSNTTFAVASPLSATLGALEGETLELCAPFATSMTIASTGGNSSETLSFSTAAFVDSQQTFDSQGNPSVPLSFGWSMSTNAAITACP
jgi:hypothetical protein